MNNKMYVPLVIILFSVSICYGNQSSVKIPESVLIAINEFYPGSKIATKSDFGKYFLTLKENYSFDVEQYFNTIIIADLNSDSINDYTLLLINKENRSFSFVTFISNGNIFSHYLLSSSNWPEKHDSTIWQVMWLKPACNYGLAKEKYFNAPDKDYPYSGSFVEKDDLEYKEAVEKYKNMVVIEKTDAPYGALEEDDLFYCKTAFFYRDNNIQSVSKCD